MRGVVCFHHKSPTGFQLPPDYTSYADIWGHTAAPPIPQDINTEARIGADFWYPQMGFLYCYSDIPFTTAFSITSEM